MLPALLSCIILAFLPTGIPGGPVPPGPTPSLHATTPPAKRDLGIFNFLRREARRTDWELGSDVREAFWKDRELAGLNLVVVVQQGVAHLHGTVPSEALRQRAAAVARTVRGISSVDNHLRVRQPAADVAPSPRQHPPIDAPWPNHDGTWTPAPFPLGKTKTPAEPKPAALVSNTAILPPLVRNASADGWQPPQARHVAPTLLPPEIEPPTDCLQGLTDLRRSLPQWQAVPIAPPVQVAPGPSESPFVGPAADRHPALYTAVRAVLQGDARFRDVRFRMEEAGVVVSGAVDTLADCEELFRLLGMVPNLASVSSEGLMIRRWP